MSTSKEIQVLLQFKHQKIPVDEVWIENINQSLNSGNMIISEDAEHLALISDYLMIPGHIENLVRQKLLSKCNFFGNNKVPLICLGHCIELESEFSMSPSQVFMDFRSSTNSLKNFLPQTQTKQKITFSSFIEGCSASVITQKAKELARDERLSKTAFALSGFAHRIGNFSWGFLDATRWKEVLAEFGKFQTTTEMNKNLALEVPPRWDVLFYPSRFAIYSALSQISNPS